MQKNIGKTDNKIPIRVSSKNYIHIHNFKFMVILFFIYMYIIGNIYIGDKGKSKNVFKFILK